MPVTIQPTSLKYKNTSGQFQTATAIKGEDGISPTIAITDITGGHRITITDADGAHSWDVMDGETPTVPVQDVQVNGTSVLSNGVANVPIASTYLPGVVQAAPGSSYYGVGINNSNVLRLYPPSEASIKEPFSKNYSPITPSVQHTSTFYGLAKAAGADMASLASTTVGVYPEAQKSAISTMLNGSVPVSGTTPTITALPGIRYVCGEVATLDITLPANGIVDVVFESGSTPTVLTATGVTWPAWFDATALEANTTYEISIADGYGAVMSWS